MAGSTFVRSSIATCVALLLLVGVSTVATASPGRDASSAEDLASAVEDGPAVQALRGALEGSPGFAGLVPAPDGDQRLLALFDGSAPQTLPRHLVPAGWTLETREDLRYEPLHYVTDEPLAELHDPHGPPVPEDSVGIGPGSTLITNFYDPVEDSTFTGICTAAFVFRDVDTGKVYLGAAGHCFMGSSFTSTHGDDADWDPANTLRVRVCVSTCLGGVSGLFSAAFGVYPGATRDIGVGEIKLDYARAGGLGSDFGIVEIPPDLFGEIRTDMPVWNGPGTSDPNRRVQIGDQIVHYGNGIVVGETFPTKGRTGVGVTSNDQRWLADLASSQGDSGSAVNIATAGGEDVVEGHWAAGILTHLVVGVGIVGGTNTERAIAMAQQDAGFRLEVVHDPAGLQGGGEDPGGDPGPEPELSNLEHVYNFDPTAHDPGWSPRAGSDLEFFSHTVPLRDYETGAFVDTNGDPLPAGEEPVLAERDFAVMGSYQRGGYVFDITDPEDPRFVSQVTCRQDRNDVAIRRFTDPETGETRVVLALSQQSGVPCGGNDDGGVGVQVNSPQDLTGFHAATQWSGTAPVAGQTADLVYAGTGCTPAHYAGVDVGGKIALVDKRVNDDGVEDCPTFTFKQKMDAAEQAGAIGLVQVDEDDAPSGGNAVGSGIPGLEITNSAGVPVRDAVTSGTAVNVTLTASSSMELVGAGSGGVGVFDITDPYAWEPMYALLTGHGGVHNFIFHPTQPYGYASNGALPGGIDTIPIVDFTDLDAPVVRPGPQTEGGVHDLEFSPEGDRAYAASENNYRIYDTTDAADPVLLSRTPNVGSYAHGVFPTSDRSLMVTNNESLVIGGFLVEGTGVCPGEGLAAYDIEGDKENAPVGPVGYYAPDTAGDVGGPCTSHFGRFAPDTRMLSMGWYVSGTRIVDWSNPSLPEEVAAAVMPGANTWAAKFHEGPYVYAGDLNRGFDVFRWTGEGPAPWVTEEDEPTAGVEVSCTDCPAEIRSGESGTAQVEVRNTGDSEDTYDLGVEDVPDGWRATVEPQEVTVGPGESGQVTVTIEVPRRAQKGDHELTVTATSSNDPTVTGSAPVEVRVHKGPPSDKGRPGSDGPGGDGDGGGTDGGATGVAASHTGPLPSPGTAALLALVLIAVAALTRPAVRAARRVGSRRGSGVR